MPRRGQQLLVGRGDDDRRGVGAQRAHAADVQPQEPSPGADVAVDHLRRATAAPSASRSPLTCRLARVASQREVRTSKPRSVEIGYAVGLDRQRHSDSARGGSAPRSSLVFQSLRPEVPGLSPSRLPTAWHTDNRIEQIHR